MTLIHQAIAEIIENISALAFDITVVPCNPDPIKPGGGYISSIHILGDWNGTVTVEISTDTVRETSARVLGLDGPEMVEFYHVQQFMQEFANMTAGNLKPMLGEQCALSTPKCRPTAETEINPPDCTEIARVAFNIVPNTESAPRQSIVGHHPGHVLVRVFETDQDYKKHIAELVVP